MVEILHLIKKHADNIALDVVREQSKYREVAVLLLNDGVLDHNLVDSGIKTYAARTDIEARGIKTEIVQLDYDDIVDMIFSSNRVVCW